MSQVQAIERVLQRSTVPMSTTTANLIANRILDVLEDLEREETQ